MTADEPYNLSEAEKHLLSAAVKSYVEADAALDVLVGEVAAKLQCLGTRGSVLMVTAAPRPRLGPAATSI